MELVAFVSGSCMGTYMVAMLGDTLAVSTSTFYCLKPESFRLGSIANQVKQVKQKPVTSQQKPFIHLHQGPINNLPFTGREPRTSKKEDAFHHST